MTTIQKKNTIARKPKIKTKSLKIHPENSHDLVTATSLNSAQRPFLYFRALGPLPWAVPPPARTCDQCVSVLVYSISIYFSISLYIIQVFYISLSIWLYLTLSDSNWLRRPMKNMTFGPPPTTSPGSRPGGDVFFFSVEYKAWFGTACRLPLKRARSMHI